jgi:hypothetical protein
VVGKGLSASAVVVVSVEEAAASSAGIAIVLFEDVAVSSETVDVFRLPDVSASVAGDSVSVAAIVSGVEVELTKT